LRRLTVLALRYAWEARYAASQGSARIGSDTVNSYLVVGEGGVTIIDAGLPRYWNLLKRELERLGLTLSDVRALILTHGDSDTSASPPS